MSAIRPEPFAAKMPSAVPTTQGVAHIMARPLAGEIVGFDNVSIDNPGMSDATPGDLSVCPSKRPAGHVRPCT